MVNFEQRGHGPRLQHDGLLPGSQRKPQISALRPCSKHNAVDPVPRARTSTLLKQRYDLGHLDRSGISAIRLLPRHQPTPRVTGVSLKVAMTTGVAKTQRAWKRDIPWPRAESGNQSSGCLASLRAFSARVGYPRNLDTDGRVSHPLQRAQSDASSTCAQFRGASCRVNTPTIGLVEQLADLLPSLRHSRMSTRSICASGPDSEKRSLPAGQR